MVSKVKAFGTESAKRIPYIVFVLLILLLVQGARSYSKTVEAVNLATKNSEKVRILTEQNTDLLKKNKELNEQAVKISRENSAHIDCVAQLFARYTQVGIPVYLADNDLNQCIVRRLSNDTTNTPNTTSPQSKSSSGGGSRQASGNDGSVKNEGTTNKSPSTLEKIGDTADKVINFINPF